MYCLGCWSPREISSVAASVRIGDVTSVKYLALCQSEPFYTMDDIKEVFEILPVAKSLSMSVLGLPEEMGLEQWRAVADNVNGLEAFNLSVTVDHYYDNDWDYEHLQNTINGHKRDE